MNNTYGDEIPATHTIAFCYAIWAYAKRNNITSLVVDCYNARMSWEEIAAITLKNA